MGVSILVPHYGPPAHALALVAKLLDQKTSVVMQIIVVDDCSPEPFPAIDGVDVVRRAANGGFGSAVNSGAAVALGELLLILNSDLDVSVDFVDQMVQAAGRFPGAVLSPRVERDDGRLEWTGRAFPRVHHQAVEWLTALARWRESDWWHRAVGHDLRTRDGDKSVDWVIGAAMLISTEAFRAAGGFDEQFFMNCEEIDLQRRLHDLGVPSIGLASPVAIHAGGGSSPSEVRRDWIVESRLRYAQKWGGRRRLQVALLAATAINLGWNTGRKISGRDVHPIRIFRREFDLVTNTASVRSPRLSRDT